MSPIASFEFQRPKSTILGIPHGEVGVNEVAPEKDGGNRRGSSSGSLQPSLNVFLYEPHQTVHFDVGNASKIDPLAYCFWGDFEEGRDFFRGEKVDEGWAFYDGNHGSLPFHAQITV